MSARTEPLIGAHGAFPMGEYHGLPAEADGSTMRPFGLRFAAPPAPSATTPPVDFSTWAYDDRRQVAVVRDGGSVIEAVRHSTGPTQTPTNTGDGTRFERDDDVTED